MASALTTTTKVQRQLGISTDDAIIDDIVAAVNTQLENVLGITVSSATYTNEEYDIDRQGHVLVLKNKPVTTFTSLQSKDKPLDFDDDNWTTIGSDEYKVDLDEGLVTWTAYFLRGKARYRATYTAGYASIPDDLSYAATILATAYYNQRKGGDIASEKLGQYARTFTVDRTNWKNLGIDEILSHYKSSNDWFESGYDASKGLNGTQATWPSTG